MFRDISRSVRDAIGPIWSDIMWWIILTLGYIVANYFDVLGISTRYKTPIPEIIYIVACVVALLVALIIFHTMRVLFFGGDVEFPKGKSKISRFSSIYQDGKDVFEIPIFLPIKNRDQNIEILCYAKLEQFENVYYANTLLRNDDPTSRALEESNLLRKEEPRLMWDYPQYQTPECEMKIPPQEWRRVLVAKLRFMLKDSFDANQAVGHIGLYYCKNPEAEPSRRRLLGLYSVSIAFKYKKSDDNIIRTKHFKGYIYASIDENNTGWSILEKDIRNRLECEVIFESGDPAKNKDIPKPGGGKMSKQTSVQVGKQ